MIVVSIERSPRYIVQIRGHAGYAEVGKDIVCAAVSTLSYFLCSFVDRSEMVRVIRCDVKDGEMYLSMDVLQPVVTDTLETFEESVMELQNQFPDNICVLQKPEGGNL